MKKIDPADISNQELFKLLLGGVAPRPIALASTVDGDGNQNISPFSFYNAFGVNPSTLIFSPSRRGRDNTTKHTLDNVKEVPEVVISAVSYDMVHQVSLASTEYAQGVNEFEKSGLTPLPSTMVKPALVKESPLQFECKVREVVEISGRPGSGNLVVCEIVYIHMDESILDEQGSIDPDKIDLVGRMGGDYYVRTSGNAKFVVPKPLTVMGIGVDQLPQHIRLSKILTGNELAQLGNLEKLPDSDEVMAYKISSDVEKLIKDKDQLHRYAKTLIQASRPYEAIKLLMLE